MHELQQALDYIEEHLGEPIDAVELARIARTSEYHFRRMFSTLTGLGLADYVRRRRMTLAAADVLAARESMLDIAVRFGYTSADAFARAFRDVHGVSPSVARERGGSLRSQPRLTIRITIEGSATMQHRFVELDAFHLVGRSARLPLVYHGTNRAIAEFVESVPLEETIALKEYNDIEPRGLIAASLEFDEGRADGSTFTYVHGVISSAAVDGFDTTAVPASTWVVFQPADASDTALQELWAYAFSEWFAANPYELADAPEMVVINRGTGDAQWDRELWLPVMRQE